MSFDAEQFRAQVQAFCREQFPADLARKADSYVHFSKADRVRWQRLLDERGWFIGHWPAQFGGQDWGPLQRFIFVEELEYAGTPWLTHFGVSFAGPLLCAFGNAEQQRRFLPTIRNSTVWWCQGFSEPGAGSDLASLRTRARRDGDDYIVSGHKTWITMAHWADMMFALVRTSEMGPRQQGLSLLLIDMKTPGVSVRPIRTIDAREHINEVFLDEVRVPAANLVGAEGRGWAYAKLIVSNERVLVTELGKARRYLDLLYQLSVAEDADGRRLRASGGWRRRIAHLELEVECLRSLAYEAMAAAQAGSPPGVDASVLKIRGSQVQQALLEAIVEALGPAGLPAPSAGERPGHERAAGLLAEHFYARASSIYGGSNEIQTDIIAKTVFTA
jgi:alkylation response protein AidB-like acyl-CoA dehydrogenase